MNLWLPQKVSGPRWWERRKEKKSIRGCLARRTAEVPNYVSTGECQHQVLRREKTAGKKDRRNEYSFSSYKKLSVWLLRNLRNWGGKITASYYCFNKLLWLHNHGFLKFFFKSVAWQGKWTSNMGLCEFRREKTATAGYLRSDLTSDSVVWGRVTSSEG